MAQTKISINLESLIELSGRLNETYDEMFILNAALLSLMGKLRIFRGSVLLPDEELEMYRLVLAKGRTNLEALPYFEIKQLRELDKENQCETFLCNGGYKYCLPVCYQNQMLAIICLGSRLDSMPPDEDEMHYASLVSTITANALQNARNRRSLLNTMTDIEKRNQLLTTLFEMSNDFIVPMSKNHILKMLSYRLMGQLMVTRFAVFLQDNGGFHAIINRFESEPSETIVKELSCTDRIARVDDIYIPPMALEAIKNLKAEIVSPMVNHGTCKGLLLIGKKMNGEEFTNENLQFIEALGNTAITALENERLFQEEIEKKRLESELKLALDIQVNLLPDKVPDVKGFEFAGMSHPSRLVGGDYYDFINLENDRLLVAIADVSGKGMPAALLMANVQAALRSLAPLSLPLSELVLRINNIVYQNTSSDKFVSFFCGILDAREKSFRYVNAGHNPPMLLKNNGQMNTLSEGGIVLGVMDEPFPFAEDVVEVAPGELILFYTDGITEALDESGKEFGETRLEEILRINSGKSPVLIMDSILEAVHDHARSEQQYDDLTLVVMKSKEI